MFWMLYKVLTCTMMSKGDSRWCSVKHCGKVAGSTLASTCVHVERSQTSAWTEGLLSGNGLPLRFIPHWPCPGTGRAVLEKWIGESFWLRTRRCAWHENYVYDFTSFWNTLATIETFMWIKIRYILIASFAFHTWPLPRCVHIVRCTAASDCG